MNEKTRKWIAAGKTLAVNPTANVTCPECGVGRLIIKDEQIGINEAKFDRYLICDKCRSWNVITMSNLSE